MSEEETSVRAVVAAPNSGRIVTMGFPGLRPNIDGGAYIDPEMMRATLEDPSLKDCAAFIILTEISEMPAGAHAILAAALRARGVVSRHMPIVDYAAPSAEFEMQWAPRASKYQDLLDAGLTIGVACHYGAGRSGTIAARLLIERGVAPDAAIAQVRSAFPDSIESDAQLCWLMSQRVKHV